jgi:hypothetical protein
MSDDDAPADSLRRAEDILRRRLAWLERQLPLDGSDHWAWTEYAAVLAHLRRLQRLAEGE